MQFYQNLMKKKNKNSFSIKYFNFLQQKKSGLNFNCIDYPTPINQIKKFEKINKISVNVYIVAMIKIKFTHFT